MTENSDAWIQSTKVWVTGVVHALPPTKVGVTRSTMPMALEEGEYFQSAIGTTDIVTWEFIPLLLSTGCIPALLRLNLELHHYPCFSSD